MKKKVFITVVIFNVMLMAYIALLSLHQYRSTHLSCQGEFSGFNNGDFIKNKLYLNFFGDKGSSFLDGELTNGAGEKKKVRLYYKFQLIRKGNNYSVIKQSPASLAGNEVNEASLKPLFPEYMTGEHKDGIITLYRVSASSFIISNSYLPIFYCHITEQHS
ncbi:hypothetical protein MUA04_17460 [Enterobacteriaceae bacterium H11S18]|uniref:hypothetical protein n=1 Tax=Dryocola clanedunensis TaxID=2925396 RepID=UPI0022F12D55|nr:hypothetical protein [Dryocola clanedunensis]MCT4711962.1 hypothetical protein [Dryocola clanedunensis]